MQLADLNWMDVESYLKQDDRIILITGATEQHAYLSLLTDIKIPQAIAAAVAEQEVVLVAPPLNFGCSEYFMEYPGTITLSQSTFDLVVSEVVDSLMQHGFRRFFVMNGHGGNIMPAALERLQQENEGVRIVWYSWWEGEAAQQIARDTGETPNHANWLENFPFTRVAELPAGAKPTATWTGENPTRAELGDGSFGGAYQVSDATMQRLFEAVVREAAGLLRTL
jgi:creatinine amidohydrolase